MCARAPLAMSEDLVVLWALASPPLLIFLLMCREMCARAPLAMSEDLVVLWTLASPSSNISADVQGDVCPGPIGHVWGPGSTQGPGFPPLLIFLLMCREMCARAPLAMSEDLVVLRALASSSSNISADVQGDVCPGPAGHVWGPGSTQGPGFPPLLVFLLKCREMCAMSEDLGPGFPPLLIFLLMCREMCARAPLAMSEDLVVLGALASPSANISADVQGDVCPGPAGHVWGPGSTLDPGIPLLVIFLLMCREMCARAPLAMSEDLVVLRALASPLF